MQKQKLLVVEDDLGLQKQLAWCLDDYEVLLADSRSSAILQMRRHSPAVITMDLGLPPDPDGPTEGLALLQQILTMSPGSKVIVLSGNHSREHALKAIALGAYDFHAKPLDAEMLTLVVARAFYLHTMQAENRRMLQIAADSPLAGIISRDPQMLKICRSIEKVAPSSASVMLLGDSGSGKELLARALHNLSARQDKRFVAVNCAAIPDNLLEAELFGFEKGAYTGAHKQTLGKLELAHAGTFFLDEVGDMALALQAKLLRFLQERVIERLGGRNEISIDVRIVCATHQNLSQLVQQGHFREDLYYRLNEIALRIPPLRERVGDCALLAHHFRNRYCQSEGRTLLPFSSVALQAIDAYDWPGNVRELESSIRRAVVMADGAQIEAHDLGLPAPETEQPSLNLRAAREAAEYRVMVQALAKVEGNIVRAAELMGISRPTLYDLMGHHGLQRH